MVNQRIFSANVGDSSVGNAGPDAIEQDIDNLLANDQELLGQINSLDAYGVASGTDDYTATIDGYTLVEGKSVKIKFTNANTGASTLNINGTGAKSIVKGNGSALSSGNIKAGQICNLVYTGSVFQLLGEGGEYGTATASDVLQGKTIGTEDGLVEGTMVDRGTVTNTITTQGGSYTIPSGYHSGSGKVTATFSNLNAGNIKSGVNIGGIIGELIPYGSVWTQQTSSFGTTSIKSVAYGNGLWVAVGLSGKLATSSNGTSWTQQTSSFGTTDIRSVTYGNGLWVATGSSGKLATSSNGTSWTQQTSSFGSTGIYSVAYGNELWVAVGYDGKLATSSNGTSWTQQTSSFGSASIYDVAYGNGLWVAVGLSGKLATSSNGTSWTQQTSSFSSTIINSVAYGNGLWVAVGNSGKLATSSNGTSWTQQTSSFGTTDILNVTYDNGLWVAVGEEGKLATSFNGTSWTQQTSSFETTSINNIAYGNGLWIAAGASGKIATLS